MLSEANCHARLGHSKQLLKNIHSVTLASFLSTDEKIFTVATPNKSPAVDEMGDRGHNRDGWWGIVL